MPFSLKNVGVIYQRLIDREFRDQMERNIEVYVDDILVKSFWAENLVEDLEEMFYTLQRYKLKLNPSKYIFGVTSGKFISYLVTERRIEENLRIKLCKT